MIGFVLPRLLPTLTIWFSLDHKQNLSGIGTLFSLDLKLYPFDYDSDSDSDSVASDQSILNFETLTRTFFSAAVLARPFRTKLLFRACGF